VFLAQSGVDFSSMSDMAIYRQLTSSRPLEF
jgi:hypothetical protein